MDDSKTGMCERVVRVYRNRGPEMFGRDIHARFSESVPGLIAAGEMLICAQVRRFRLAYLRHFRGGEPYAEHARDSGNYAVLEQEDVVHYAVQLLFAHLCAGSRLGDVRGDPDARTEFLESAPHDPPRADRTPEV